MTRGYGESTGYLGRTLKWNTLTLCLTTRLEPRPARQLHLSIHITLGARTTPQSAGEVPGLDTCVCVTVCVCEAFSGVRSLNPARRTPPQAKGQESPGSRCQEMACFGAARFYSSLHIHAGCHDDAVAPPGGNAPWPLDWNCFNVKKRFATRVIT